MKGALGRPRHAHTARWVAVRRVPVSQQPVPSRVAVNSSSQSMAGPAGARDGQAPAASEVKGATGELTTAVSSTAHPSPPTALAAECLDHGHRNSSTAQVRSSSRAPFPLIH